LEKPFKNRNKSNGINGIIGGCERSGFMIVLWRYVGGFDLCGLLRILNLDLPFNVRDIFQ
jgi:hypothetical protein